MLHKELPALERKAKLERSVADIESALSATQERIDDLNRRRSDLAAAVADGQREIERYDVRLAELISSRSAISARLSTHVESLNGTNAELAAVQPALEGDEAPLEVAVD